MLLAQAANTNAVGMIVSQLVGVVIGSAIIALLVMLAARLVAGVSLAYLRAFKIALVAGFATWGIQFVSGFLLHRYLIAAAIVSAMLSFVASAGIYGAMIRRETDGAPIGFPRGLGVSAVITVVVFGLALIVAGAAWVAGGSFGTF